MDTVDKCYNIQTDCRYNGRDVKLTTRLHKFIFFFQPLVDQDLLIIEALRSHSVGHSTLGRTPLEERSARRRDLYLTTHKTQKDTDIHVPGGIRTRNPSKRAAADPRLTPRGLWDRPPSVYTDYNFVTIEPTLSVIISRKFVAERLSFTFRAETECWQLQM
jgi:hypothetical protein